MPVTILTHSLMQLMLFPAVLVEAASGGTDILNVDATGLYTYATGFDEMDTIDIANQSLQHSQVNINW